jgi:hypothetical protein
MIEEKTAKDKQAVTKSTKIRISSISNTKEY